MDAAYANRTAGYDIERKEDSYGSGGSRGNSSYRPGERERDRNRDRERGRDKDRERDESRDRHRSYRHHEREERSRERERRYRTEAPNDADADEDRDSHRRHRHGGRERERRSPDSRHSRRHHEDDGDDRLHRSRSPHRSRSRQRHRHYHSSAGDHQRRRDKSPIAMFDRYSVEALSPYTGAVLPLEERQRVLRNWDAAPPGFERISADKAKLTGLFPPPGNLAKITNFAPPTLDPTKAAMLALLTNSAAADSTTSYLPSGAAMFAPALSKQARRVYVGNIPDPVTEEQIAEHFNTRMAAIKPPVMGQYVLGVQIAGDRDYAFVDLRSAEEADLAIKLDGDVMLGRTLRVRRTREFQNVSVSPLEAGAEAPEQNQLVIFGLPTFLVEAHLKLLLAAFGELKFARLLAQPDLPKTEAIDKDKGLSSGADAESSEQQTIDNETIGGIAVLELADPFLVEPIRKGLDGFQIGSQYTLRVIRLPDAVNVPAVAHRLCRAGMTPGLATTDPTPIMQLLNMVTELELVSTATVADILSDIQSGCEQFGSVRGMQMPLPGEPGVGKVFVEFETVEQCMQAVRELAGCQFADRTVLTSYYPVHKYQQRIF